MAFDLVITDVTWSPASPTPGSSVLFSGTLNNIGDTASPSGIIHGIAFYVDGTVVSWSDNVTTSLASGASRIQTANGGPSGASAWTATTGTHTIRAWSDSSRFPTEAVITNNDFSKTLIVSAGTAQLTYWIANWRLNIFKDNTKPATTPSSIYIVAARNETEAAQIVTRHTSSFTIQSVTSTDLIFGSSVLSASANFKYHFVEYFFSSKNSGGPGDCDNTATDPVRFAPIDFPEQLSNAPTVAVNANTTQSIWIKYRIPTTQPVGTYTGTITVVTTAGQFNIPVSIEVNEVTLPDPKDGTFTSEWWIYPFEIDQGYGYATGSTNWWKIVDRFAAILREMRVNAHSFDTQELYGQDGNWSFHDQYVNKFESTNSLKTLSTETLGSGAVSWLNTLKPHYIAKGWWNRSYIKIIDEPSNVSTYTTLANQVKAAHPGTRIGDPGVTDPDLYGTSVDIWQPHITDNGGPDTWQTEYDVVRQRAGNEVWTYTSCYPTDAMNVHIDNRVFEITLHAWFCYTRRLTGFLFWGLAAWGRYGTTLDEIYQTKGILGDAYSLWPDPARIDIKQSIRSEAVREMAEDYELLKKLEAKSGSSVAQALASSVITDVDTYEKNISVLETKRNKLVRDASEPVVVTSPVIAERAKTSNYNVMMILGPNEVDDWQNIRVRFVTDTEAGGPAYSVAARSSIGSLSGSTGQQIILLRIYDNVRHIYEWSREKRKDVGVVYASLKQISKATNLEFNEYDMIKFAHSGAGLVMGCVNDVCDAHQFHQNQRHDRIPDLWTNTPVADSDNSPYHYWKAAQEVKAWRAANSQADNTRPLLATQLGYNYNSDGTAVGTRTDLFQLRRLKMGMFVLGPLYYGCCLINFYTFSRATLAGYNLLASDTLTYYGGTSPERDADYVFQAMDMREINDSIAFRNKSWTEYWKDWQVWFNTNQTPLGTSTTTCPFVEWNRVTMTSSSVTMVAGGRNLLARKKNLYRGAHTFSAEIKLSAAGSQACLRVSGHDKLDGLNVVSSSILSGMQDWTSLSVTFTPRQHDNPRIPDPQVCVLLVDHNGTGTCEVRNPVIGTGTGGAPIIDTYFDFEAVDVSLSPSNPTQGQAVTFSVTIKNVGNAPSPSGTILGAAFNVDNVVASWSDDTTAGLAVNEVRVQSANSGPDGDAVWIATGGQHTVTAIVDDINRLPSERYKTNNTVSKTFTVSIPSGPVSPPQAVSAGLSTLFFNDEFTSLSVYNATSNPDGTWRFNDFWVVPISQAGYVDYAGSRTFMVNQGYPTADTQPYLPASQLDATTVRIRCTRARLSERPGLRSTVNAIATAQGQPADAVTWLGAFMTTEKLNPFSPADIYRPAYIEARIRFSPSNTKGIFSSFWLYDTSEVSGSPEIDIFESNDLDPTFWKTNIHHTDAGPAFNLTNNQVWCDGNFHTFGMLWEPSSLKIYFDDSLVNSLTGANADYFSMPMRLIITHTVDPSWAAASGMSAPANVENVYMDIDYIRVWRGSSSSIAAPAPAAAVGMNSLFFNDDFTTLNFYHPVTNPGGTWRFNDFYQNADEAGYVDFAGLRTFMVNQMMSGNYNNVAHPERNFWGDATAKAAFTPYFPASQLDSTTMRLRCTRARLSERPTIRSVVNSIATIGQSQNADAVTWLGAFLTTEKMASYSATDINRPAYIECRFRMSPANIQGIFSSFWVFDTSEVEPGSPEIDIFESNDHDPYYWKTNIHHSAAGPSFNLQHNQNWCDGQFHTYGMLWEPSSLKIYYDNVLSNSLTGSNADFFSMPMRIIITHTCDAHYAQAVGKVVPTNIENVYMDIDYIRVWRTGGAPPPTPQPTASIAMSNRGNMANVGQSSGTLRNVLWRSSFFSSKRASITQVRLVYANSYLDTSGEHVGLNTIYVTASVEYNGVTKPVTFSGAREVTLAPGAVVTSDYVTITIPADSQFWTRQNVRTVNSGEKYPTGYTALAALGEGYTSTNALAGVDVAGPIAGAGLTPLFAPVAVLGVGDTGTAPSVAIIGSSSAFGEGEDFATLTAPADRGFLSRLISNKMGYIVIAAGGNSLAQWQSASAERMEILNAVKPTHVICSFGTNDIIGGANAATTQSRLQSIWTQLNNAGYKVIQTTLQPVTDSTDGFTTVGNQTATAYSADIATVNTFIRSKPSPIVDIIDYCAVVESAPDSGKWRVDGGVWSTDGIHTVRHAQVAAELAPEYNRIWLGASTTILTTSDPTKDIYDDLIIRYCATNGHPNPRLIKAQASVNTLGTMNALYTSSATPCGIHAGWTAAESRDYGLMQIAPACGVDGGGRVLLPNGHPNMATSASDPLWSTSVFNPAMNLDIGISYVTSAYNFFKSKYTGCSTTQYCLMAAAGNVGSWDAVTGCGQWTTQGQIDYLTSIVSAYEGWWGSLDSTSYDLIVTSISMSPATPTAGQEVTFSATISNIGTAATPSGVVHGISFVVDGNGFTKMWSDNVSASLLPGASRTQAANGGVTKATWTAASGSHTVIAYIDDTNRMPNEASESNNTLSRTFTVA